MDDFTFQKAMNQGGVRVHNRPNNVAVILDYPNGKTYYLMSNSELDNNSWPSDRTMNSHQAWSEYNQYSSRHRNPEAGTFFIEEGAIDEATGKYEAEQYLEDQGHVFG